MGGERKYPMTRYRITAETMDDKVIGEVEAKNEDHAWEVFCGTQKPWSVFNGVIEQLPTRDELQARITALEEAGRKVVNSREGTIARPVAIAELAALLGE
jgi:hypothetical protein